MVCLGSFPGLFGECPLRGHGMPGICHCPPGWHLPRPPSSMGLLELCPRERPQGQRHRCGDHGSARSDSQKSAWGLIRKTSPLGTQCSHGMAYQGAGGCNLCSCRFFFRIYWLNSCLQHGIAVPPHGDTAGIQGLLVTGH